MPRSQTSEINFQDLPLKDCVQPHFLSCNSHDGNLNELANQSEPRQLIKCKIILMNK